MTAACNHGPTGRCIVCEGDVIEKAFERGRQDRRNQHGCQEVPYKDRIRAEAWEIGWEAQRKLEGLK